MKLVKFKIKTWSCPNCNYRQDFEPTKENMFKHFGQFKEGLCPSCRKANLVKEKNDKKKITMSVIEGDYTCTVPKSDEKGNVVWVAKVMKGKTKEEIEAIKKKYEDK